MQMNICNIVYPKSVIGFRISLTVISKNNPVNLHPDSKTPLSNGVDGY